MASSYFQSKGVQVTTRRLTTAELSTLGDTPVELVPGVPGSMLMGVSVVGQTDPGSVPFASAPTFTVTGGVNGGASLNDLSLSSGAAGFNSAVFAGADGSTASAAGAPLIITASANPTVTGAILTSSLDEGGSLYAPGDTGTVDGGNNDATYVVDTVANSAAILGVNQGTQTFTVAGDQTGHITVLNGLQVYRSTGNDGAYTVVSATLNGGNTDVVTVEAIPSAVVDGYAWDSDQSAGALVTYTITDGGSEYVVGGGGLTATTGVGVNGAIAIDTIDPQTDMEATFTVAYYVVPVA